MDERLGHLIRNLGEEVWISLRNVGGHQQVELRVYEGQADVTAELAPGKERIAIPVDLLPALVRALSQVQDALANRGLLYMPPAPTTTQMERGDAFALGAVDRPKSQAARQYPRVAVNVRGECRLLDKKDFWPGKPVAGEVMNVSMGGAQVRLPQRLPRFSQVELFMVVDGMVFRGRAEVAGADAEAQRGATAGQFRHSLRWVSLEGPAPDVLTKVVASRTPKRADSTG
jgi:PilZ domain